jgi:hypothetical protein
MYTFRLAPIFRERLAPLRPLAGGEGGTRRGISRKPAGLIRGDGRVRWVAPLLGTAGIPHLTPTLFAPKGGEGDISATQGGRCGLPVPDSRFRGNDEKEGQLVEIFESVLGRAL